MDGQASSQVGTRVIGIDSGDAVESEVACDRSEFIGLKIVDVFQVKLGALGYERPLMTTFFVLDDRTVIQATGRIATVQPLGPVSSIPRTAAWLESLGYRRTGARLRASEENV